MSPDTAVGVRRASTVVAMTTAKRAVRSGLVWGLLFGGLVANEALSYHANFPTVATREKFAQAFGHNAAFAALLGPARRLDSIGGMVAWRVFALVVLVGAIWGLLTASRLLRHEEDAGRWEMLLAGHTTRGRATAQALAGLGAGWLAMWALTATFTVLAGSRADVGFSFSESIFYATAATAGAAMFLAVGALASQLAATRRQANAIAAAVFAASFLIRLVADSVTGLGWMRWGSPLGWVENLHPLTGSQPLVLVPVVALTAAASGLAITLAARRDLGSAVLVRDGSGTAHTPLLDTPALLVVRLERWVALAWIAGLAVMAFIFGVTARTAAGLNPGLDQTLVRLGGDHASPVATWIGYEFLYLAALACFAAANQVSAMRREEAEGHLDNLLARHLDRGSWLAGRLGFGAALAVAAGLAMAVGGWLGVAGRHGGIGLPAMLQAGLNVTVPALFVLGLGALIYGLAPRLAAPILYALVLWSFLIEIVGSSITTNHVVLDTALFSRLGAVPAASLNWPAIEVLTGLGLAAALAGLASFRRRDLAPA